MYINAVLVVIVVAVDLSRPMTLAIKDSVDKIKSGRETAWELH